MLTTLSSLVSKKIVNIAVFPGTVIQSAAIDLLIPCFGFGEARFGMWTRDPGLKWLCLIALKFYCIIPIDFCLFWFRMPFDIDGISLEFQIGKNRAVLLIRKFFKREFRSIFCVLYSFLGIIFGNFVGLSLIEERKHRSKSNVCMIHVCGTHNLESRLGNERIQK